MGLTFIPCAVQVDLFSAKEAGFITEGAETGNAEKLAKFILGSGNAANVFVFSIHHKMLQSFWLTLRCT